MTRINAGSTLANQYAPPFVVSKSVATNWQLRYNANILAFEAFDPNENVVVSGFNSIEVAWFPSVTQQVFVVPWLAATKESVFVTIQGVKQQQDAYTVITNTGSGTTTITLADTVSSEDVEILGLQASGGASIQVLGPVNADAAVPNTAQADFDLGWLAPSVQSLIVSIDGLKQDTSAYSIVPNATATDTTLTFTETPSMSITTPIVIVNGGTGYSVGNILTIAGGTFTTAATLTVASEAGGVITGVTISNAGIYTVFPTGTLATSGAGINATFTVTKDSQRIEVIGILTAGETPASPVSITNIPNNSVGTADTIGLIPTTAPYFGHPTGDITSSKTLSGDAQILRLKSLNAGTNITLTSAASDTVITIDADTGTFANIGSGVPLTTISTLPLTVDAKRLWGSYNDTAKGRIIIDDTTVANSVYVNYNLGYKSITDADSPYTVEAGKRLINVLPGAATTVLLPVASTFAPGDTITIKDANGLAGTNNIIVTPDASDKIDSALDGVATTLSTPNAYITLYSDGSDWHIIAQG